MVEVNRSPAADGRKLFSRDLNYLRDAALFWPFVIYSMLSVGAAFSPPLRELALRCAAVAAVALLLARERLFLFVVALGFIAFRCVVALVLHPWNWGIFIAGILTGGPFLLANHYWRNPRLAYKIPDKMRLLDALWSIVSIIGSLVLAYFVSPFN